MGHVERAADPGDKLRLRGRFRSQAMVDRSRFDVARPGSRGEQEQSEAIGPAGNRQPNLPSSRVKPVEVGCEPAD